MNEYNKIEKKLNLSFENLKLLESALNHSSLKNDNALIKSNEILSIILNVLFKLWTSTKTIDFKKSTYQNDKSEAKIDTTNNIKANKIGKLTYMERSNKKGYENFWTFVSFSKKTSPKIKNNENKIKKIVG